MIAGVLEVKGGNSALDLKNSPDEAETIVTKALADFQKAVDDRLKALEDNKTVETKSADHVKLVERLDAFVFLQRPDMGHCPHGEVISTQVLRPFTS